MSDDGPRVREIVTPEGVALPFEVASVFDRASAVAIDLILIHLVVAVVIVLAALLAGGGLGAHALSVGLLLSFVLRTFYFAYYEIRTGGSTPGKRRLNVRVVARSGGPLTAEAVLARNFTREFEIFLPMTALASPQSLLPGLPAAAALLGCVWLLVGGLLPLFNRDRLRLGDLLGGTIVVTMPRTVLLEDPAARERPTDPRVQPASRYRFSADQLDQYGIDELHVLEGLMRRGDHVSEADLLRAVATKIQDKIGWESNVPSSESREFLMGFYTQLRARLEHKATFGVRQQRKKAGKLRRPESPPPLPPSE